MAGEHHDKVLQSGKLCDINFRCYWKLNFHPNNNFNKRIAHSYLAIIYDEFNHD